LRPSVNSVLEFLLLMYKRGCKYSGICAARSALAAVVNIPGYSSLSDHPMITRFIKGIHNRYPPLPRYVKIWDINQVLEHYNKLPENSLLSLKELTHKLVLLLMILGARRKQSLLHIHIDNIKITDAEMVLLPHTLQKHTKPGRTIEPIVYKRFCLNAKLCVVHCMTEYLGKRNLLVPAEIKQLFITYGHPHRPATNDTISRWIQNGLKSAGIDTQTFRAHSCRAAAASKARQIGISREEIMKRGCWSSDSIFKTFYDKDIINAKNTEGEDKFVEVILSQAV